MGVGIGQGRVVMASADLGSPQAAHYKGGIPEGAAAVGPCLGVEGPRGTGPEGGPGGVGTDQADSCSQDSPRAAGEACRGTAEGAHLVDPCDGGMDHGEELLGRAALHPGGVGGCFAGGSFLPWVDPGEEWGLVDR